MCTEEPHIVMEEQQHQAAILCPCFHAKQAYAMPVAAFYLVSCFFYSSACTCNLFIQTMYPFCGLSGVVAYSVLQRIAPDIAVLRYFDAVLEHPQAAWVTKQTCCLRVVSHGAVLVWCHTSARHELCQYARSISDI